MSFQEYYNSEIKKKLKEELNISNIMAVPKVIKIVIVIVIIPTPLSQQQQ